MSFVKLLICIIFIRSERPARGQGSVVETNLYEVTGTEDNECTYDVIPVSSLILLFEVTNSVMNVLNAEFSSGFT